MKLCVPEYFNKFHCIAAKCKDCCCGGWEIEIDEDTAKYYKSIGGEFGQKLKENINFNNTPHFIFNKNHKCPFLNKDNLCDIFINLGEDKLCEICAQHPRFYEWFKDQKEGGIGLCCEEAARIILSYNSPFKTYEINIPNEAYDMYDSKLYNYIFKCRNKIISHLDNTCIPFNSRIRSILWYTYSSQLNIDSDILDYEDIINIDSYSKNNIQKIIDFFLALEPLDINWPQYLKSSILKYNNSIDKFEEFEKNTPEINNYLKNISIYFVWRYFLKGVFDKDIISKIQFMVVSIAILRILFFCKWIDNETITFDDCVEITKNYSKEIEYSEENLIKLENAFYTNKYFSVDNLIGLF